MNTAKPVTILTGFLGAGKTSFLNAWIKENAGRRPVIIENEVGETNVDAELIVNTGEQIFAMSGGCICCDQNEEFFDLLRGLWKKTADFDEIIIEATGVADPAQVAYPFKQAKSTELFYKIERVICLIDTALIESELKHTEIARLQIAFSDILLLNKTDCVTQAQEDRVRELLSAINPMAAVLSGNVRDGYPMTEIKKLNRATIDNQPFPVEKPKPTIRLRPLHYASDAITSLHFRFEEAFDLDELKYRMLSFLNFQAANIYRVKGIIYVKDCPNKVIVQSVSHLLAVSEGNAWQEGEVRQSDIVVIGKQLKPEGFEKLFRRCFFQSKESAGS